MTPTTAEFQTHTTQAATAIALSSTNIKIRYQEEKLLKLL